MAGYVELLLSGEKEVDALFDSMHISYSLFFRNSLDVSFLEQFVLPDLIRFGEKSNSQSIRMWSVGSAQGEEAYTLAMLVDKVAGNLNVKIRSMVFGTDISAMAVDKSRAGTYERAALSKMKLSYFDNYFIEQKSNFTVIKEIREQAHFTQRDILDTGFTSPPEAVFADFDLVSCCNLLIYYHNDTQQEILEKLYNSLNQNGFLIVGESERLIVEKYGKFCQVNPMVNIFTKK
jgi:chemotaxis methyl-accepting protein methylase